MLTQAHGTQGFNLWAVRGARTPMNVGFAPSLEYYRLGGLCLLRTLDITNNHGETFMRLSVNMQFSQF